MEYSTIEPWQAVDLSGVIYDNGSLYAHFMEMEDPRKDRGKRYRLETLLALIFLAKMSGADSPSAIAEWNKERQTELIGWLHLSYERTFKIIFLLFCATITSCNGVQSIATRGRRAAHDANRRAGARP